MFAHLVVFFDGTGRPDVAATFYGADHHPDANQGFGFDAALDHVRTMLDTDTFDTCVRTGAAMTTTEAVHYANHHIELARQHQP